MDRRLALVALWVVFAAASVGVGFAAAGLVGDPFTDPGAEQVAASAPPPTTASAGTPTRSGTPLASPSPSGRRSSPTARPSGGSEQPAVRSLSTRAGLVSGSCRGGLVTVSASPAVGWYLDEVSQGREEEATVKFRRTGDREGEVEVHARCSSGVPRFTLDDRQGGSSGSGGGDD